MTALLALFLATLTPAHFAKVSVTFNNIISLQRRADH